jgi:hypothetical protein
METLFASLLLSSLALAASAETIGSGSACRAADPCYIGL